MISRVFLGFGVLCALLCATTESDAARRGVGLSSPGFSRSAQRTLRPQHVSVRRHATRGYYRSGHRGYRSLAGGIAEELVSSAVDAIVDQIELGGTGGLPTYEALIELPPLHTFGVPDYMEPHVYGLLTSGHPRLINRGQMLLMHYQLNALAYAEGAFRDKRPRRVVYSRPLK